MWPSKENPRGIFEALYFVISAGSGLNLQSALWYLQEMQILAIFFKIGLMAWEVSKMYSIDAVRR
jgi:hypothetical protein